MADIGAKFAEAEIVPKIIPNAPANQLTVNYEGVMVEPGMLLGTRQIRFGPRVTFNSDPEALYTLIMIDPDNLSRAKPTVAEWLHLLTTNIPASNLQSGIMGGTQVMTYGAPVPGPRTGEHRYVMLLWEHEGRRINAATPNSRAKFSVKAFMEKHKLGDPIAGTYYVAQNEQG